MAGPQGEAGRRGEDVRSDLHVRFEATGGGGHVIELVSRVEPYYGEAIRRQAAETLGAFGIENGRLVMTDGGALPFVLAARIETAIRRAGIWTGPSPIKAHAESRPGTARDRLRRSRLYLPGNEPRFMMNAGLHDGDGIILDLEDSVHPDEKDAARSLTYHALRSIDFGRSERMVRINQLPLGFDDLEVVIPAEPDLVLIPKVESPDQVLEVERKIRSVHETLGTERSVWLMPILESALGVEQALAIASAARSVASLTIGLEDYTADLGVVKTPEGAESLYARSRLLNAARAAGCQAIDSVYGDVGDMDGLRQWAKRSRAMGYEGMGCIHPRQIRVIHEAFAPEPAEIDRALRIVEAFEKARARGLAVVSLGSKMIDPPVVNRARKLVDQARAMGLLPDEGGKGEAES